MEQDLSNNNSNNANNNIINSGDRHTTATHPLQDVPLHNDDDNINPNATTTTTTATNNSKSNWVKFDDDANEIGSNSNNNNNSSDAVDNATRITNAATTSSATILEPPNRLSPLPTSTETSSSIARARPRTPTSAATTTSTAASTMESKSSQQRDHSPMSAPVPIQRTSTAMPDVAPAVLTTESTHVNLNASGRSQQQHQQQKSPQHQKFKATTTLTNAHLNQQHTTSSTSTSATSPHHHHQLQQQQQQQQHHNNNGATITTQSHHTMMAAKNVTATPSTLTSSVTIPVETSTSPPMRTIELSTGRIREGFANGDVIVTLLPANTKWPWITPAIFRPELVPEELMAQGLTLTVEDYVNAMETLVNDFRFTLYNVCYKRILVCWIFFAFAVLLTLLFSGLQGVALFSLGVGWLFLNAAAIFLCMWVKLRLSRGLEKCLARVNRQLMKHKILLVLDDRGRISCHKVNLCFMYFDATQCVNFLNEFLEQTEQNGGEAIKAGWEAKLDIDMNDIVIQGTNPVRLSRKQAVAQELFLSYLQRWGKDFLRRRLDWTVQEAGVHEIPRHLQSSICPCQYEEELLRNKIKISLQRKQCCGVDCIGCWL